VRRLSTIWLCFVGLSLPGVVQADFCADLDSVLESAASGFAAVKGELISDHQDALSDTRVVWQCTLALTGANTCEVEWFRQAFTYNTFWHKQTEEANAASFEALRELLLGCGLSEKETTKSGRSIWFVIEDRENLDVILTLNARRVRLSLTTSGFPNP
jgi:hypothetical protein